LVSLNSCNDSPPKGFFELSKQKSKEINNNLKLETNDKPLKTRPALNLISNSNVKSKLVKYGQLNEENNVLIKTKYGDIHIRLYDDTPLHRANFIMLAKKKFFDSTLFYRVINNFMIQGGNSDKDNVFQKMAKIGFYRVPSEISANHLHKRGALAMAVKEQYYKDPLKKDLSSSPYNFFIVQKGPISDPYMDKLELTYKIKIPKKNRTVYKNFGGNPHLDNEYTVFGEVIKGMSVVDEISLLRTDGKDRPLKNVYLTVKVF
jgi:peptidyl-prolyl cis-trans isomerase A (cyclophilin A)